MDGIPRLSKREVTTSPSRTYIIVVRDIVCQNEARFVKIVLPTSFINSSREARYYYNSICEDRALQIIDCVTFEDYMALASEVIEDTMFEKPKTKEPLHSFDTKPVSLEHDMSQVRRLLDAWNDEQENPSTTFTMILTNLMRQFQKVQIQSKLSEEFNQTLISIFRFKNGLERRER